MGNSKETKVVDHDYSLMPVPKFARRRFLTMFMIMLGFTFFSASMWTGQQLGDSMDLPGFIGALALGGAILAVYTGALAYVGARRGFRWIFWRSIPLAQRAPICRRCSSALPRSAGLA